MPLQVKAEGKTDTGKVRATNQDSFLINSKDKLFIVADGMGGHAGGEIASKLCIEKVSAYLSDKEDIWTEDYKNRDIQNKIMSTLSGAVNFASAKIYEYALEDPTLRGMGTTATVVKIIDDTAFCAHVGDSRLYLIRSNFLYQITNDHSLVSEQVRAGIISQEEAQQHHLKNVITRSVGYQQEEDVDTMSIELKESDYLVICSDGLHGKVDDKEISNIIAKGELNSVNQLITLANERGGEDNITVIVVNVQDFNK